MADKVFSYTDEDYRQEARRDDAFDAANLRRAVSTQATHTPTPWRVDPEQPDFFCTLEAAVVLAGRGGGDGHLGLVRAPLTISVTLSRHPGARGPAHLEGSSPATRALHYKCPCCKIPTG